MLNFNFWRIFCDVISLLAQICNVVSFDMEYKEVFTKIYWTFSMAQFLWYDCTFKILCTVPVTLTFNLWRSIFCSYWVQPYVNILYKFQIDISSNSREIKYQNIGRTHRHIYIHTYRQTDRVKTIPRNPLRGRGNYINVHVPTDII